MIIKLRLILVGLFLGAACGAYAESAGTPIGKYNKVLFKSSIDKSDGTEVLIKEAFFPPDWKAPRHYHNGNLFIYVIEGEFEVHLEGGKKTIYKKGEALQMKPGVEMEARNASDTHPLKLSVFQVGQANVPFVVPVK